MAKSLDQLIEFLLEEIALGGEDGESHLFVLSKWDVGRIAEHGLCGPTVKNSNTTFWHAVRTAHREHIVDMAFCKS